MGASRDSGVLEFSYRKISAVKQWKSLQGSQSKNLDFFEFPRVSTGAHPLTKKPEDSGYEIGSLPDPMAWSRVCVCARVCSGVGEGGRGSNKEFSIPLAQINRCGSFSIRILSTQVVIDN